MNREECMALLEWANGLNPGPWKDHSLTAARAAEAIAARCGMDSERAWKMGLLHDIGRYEGWRYLHHVIVGYNLLMEKGEPDLARICMTHSFPDGNPLGYIGEWDVSEEDRRFVIDYIGNREMDEYDRLIQLCDAICGAEGVILMEKRLVNVAMRYGFSEGMYGKWQGFFAIKAEFENRMGTSIYAPFEECVEATFGCIPGRT